MIIQGQNFRINSIFDSITTIPDCFVVAKNKIGSGHGEAKFYFTSKENASNFFGKSGFVAKCFILKSDVINYMNAIKNEYLNPSQNYRGKDELPVLWKTRMQMIEKMNEVETFTIIDQVQITGPRGYINTDKSDNYGYQIIREISLPLVSYIQVMELKDNANAGIFYWKIFADFDAIYERKSIGLVLRYGKKEDVILVDKPQPQKDNVKLSRVGQGIYRSNLLVECPFCPITNVADERLLIASHIKPWAISNDKERIHAKNGLMLTPVYDKLFDRGFITFSEGKHLITSNWVNPSDFKRLNVVNDKYYPLLPFDSEREVYMQYHRQCVFKG